jgi:hypothetical protein
MKREDILKLAFEKSKSFSEAKEAAEWMASFVDGNDHRPTPEKEKMVFHLENRAVKSEEQLDKLRHSIPSKNPKRHNHLWSEKQVTEIIELNAAGYSRQDIAVLMDRKPNAVRDVLYKIRTGRQVGKFKKTGGGKNA